MAFNATSVTLENGLRRIREIASQERAYLGDVLTALNGTVNANQVLDVVSNIDRVVPLMDSYAALPGMGAYAQAQLGGANYDIAAEYAAMRSALVAVRTWLGTNIPADAIQTVNGIRTPSSFAPAATAPLKALVGVAYASIS